MTQLLNNMSQTWNSPGVTKTGIKLNITDTASASDSLLMDLRVGDISRFKVGKAGNITIPNSTQALQGLAFVDDGMTGLWGLNNGVMAYGGTSRGEQFRFVPNGRLIIGYSGSLEFTNGASSVTPDLVITRDAANILAQRNGVNAQQFRLYNTYTDASNYERVSLGWSANVFSIACEKAGTGSFRSLRLSTTGDIDFYVNGSRYMFVSSAAGRIGLLAATQLTHHLWIDKIASIPGPAAADALLFYVKSSGGQAQLAAKDEAGNEHIIVSRNGSQALIIPVSDESTALTTGAGKMTFRMPYAFKLLGVRASVNTAPVGATLNIDINENGVSVLSTVLSIDSGEKTSTTAATPAVISDADIADDAEITIDIDQVGSSVAGAGLKITLIGSRQ